MYYKKIFVLAIARTGLPMWLANGSANKLWLRKRTSSEIVANHCVAGKKKTVALSTCGRAHRQRLHAIIFAEGMAELLKFSQADTWISMVIWTKHAKNLLPHGSKEWAGSSRFLIEKKGLGLFKSWAMMANGSHLGRGSQSRQPLTNSVSKCLA